MDHFLSITKGLFGIQQQTPEASLSVGGEDQGQLLVAEEVMMEEESFSMGRKRLRDGNNVGCLTPSLLDESRRRRHKRIRIEVGVDGESVLPTVVLSDCKQEKTACLGDLPEDTLAHCLGFLGSSADRHSLQLTNRQFRRISNRKSMMEAVDVGGEQDTGLGGIIQEEDTPASAEAALTPFVEAGNLEAVYMLGIIKSYCGDVIQGIDLLKQAATQDYVRASYALGLILRDSDSKTSLMYMEQAAKKEYLPALQESLSAREMKRQYGEPPAETLRKHLDPLGLNRLLARHYVTTKELRSTNTSHCWNPLCGRWAVKANAPPPKVMRVSRMKMCSRCCRAKYCSKLCQVYDWRSNRHKNECQFL